MQIELPPQLNHTNNYALNPYSEINEEKINFHIK